MSEAPGWRLAIHDDLASTQDLVLAAAEAGEAGGLAILARRQSAGRGTQGRGWASAEGNLFLSFLLRPNGPARELPQWGLLAGVALAETVAPLLPDPRLLRLKWPNDLLLGGAKCAGILSQGGLDAEGRIGWFACGIGVNLAVAPPLPDRPTTSLAVATGRAPDPVGFARQLLAAVAHWRGQGLPAVRAAWMARGPALDTPLELRHAGTPRKGRFAGLDGDGRLLLATPGGVLPVAAGEVVG